MSELPAAGKAASVAESATSPTAPPSHRGAAHRAWVRGLLRLLSFALLGLLVGAMFAHTLFGFTLALLVYIFIEQWHLRALRLWLESPKHHELPELRGVWGEIFEGLQDLQRSNRKRKKRLAAILSEFQSSTAALPDGAVVLGEHGEINWFNNAAQALLGLRTGQDLGLRVANLVRHPNFAEYFSRPQYDGEVEVPSPINPGVTLSLRIIPYGNNQRLLIVRDVSEFRRLEVARRDFVSNASHELRTPLTVLRGYLDMIEPDARKDGPLAPWRMPLSEMKAQATRMELLIKDMLKLARLESDVYDSRHEFLDVPHILERVVEEAKAVSQGQHRFEVRIEPDVWLYGRESEVQSIFSNLVTNAVRYTLPQGLVCIRWWGDMEGAHFAVSDSGIGIADEDIPRLTERFYRVDVGRSRASGGTGLGLSIVKHAIERHEGSLIIDSQLGVGSTFNCHFPPHRSHRQPLLNSDKRVSTG